MLELPEVEHFKRVAGQCAGAAVRRAIVDDPGILQGVSPGTLQRRLKGSRVASVRRHGKHLFLDLAGDGCLAMHFGTNGSLRLMKEGEDDPRYIRLSLVFDNGGRLAYVNPRRIGNETCNWRRTPMLISPR